MAKIFLERGVDPAEVQARLERAASQEGLPFGKRTKTFNSRLAQELGKWAESIGMGEHFHDAAYRACLVEGKNIASVSVLVDLADSIGLSRQEATRVLETRAFSGQVDQDWSHSRRMNVQVIPTLAIGESTLVGAQSYEKMERFVIKNNVKPKR